MKQMMTRVAMGKRYVVFCNNITFARYCKKYTLQEKVGDKKTPAKKEITEIEKDRARQVIEILSS